MRGARTTPSPSAICQGATSPTNSAYSGNNGPIVGSGITPRARSISWCSKHRHYVVLHHQVAAFDLHEAPGLAEYPRPRQETRIDGVPVPIGALALAIRAMPDDDMGAFAVLLRADRWRPDGQHFGLAHRPMFAGGVRQDDFPAPQGLG